MFWNSFKNDALVWSVFQNLFPTITFLFSFAVASHFCRSLAPQIGCVSDQNYFLLLICSEIPSSYEIQEFQNFQIRVYIANIFLNVRLWCASWTFRNSLWEVSILDLYLKLQLRLFLKSIWIYQRVSRWRKIDVHFLKSHLWKFNWWVHKWRFSWRDYTESSRTLNSEGCETFLQYGFNSWFITVQFGERMSLLEWYTWCCFWKILLALANIFSASFVFFCFKRHYSNQLCHTLWEKVS